MPRWKKPGFSSAKPQRRNGYGRMVRQQVEVAVQSQLQTRPARFIDPSLILRIQMQGTLFESDWESLDLTLLASDEDRNLVLFSSAGNLEAFIQRLVDYDGPAPEGQKSRRYEDFVSCIESVGTLTARDRLGYRMKKAGIAKKQDLLEDVAYMVDIELWDFGNRSERRRKTEEIEGFIGEGNGEVFDIYIGPSITLMRVHAAGQFLRLLLEVPDVAFVDLPPKPDLEASALVKTSFDDAPPAQAPEDDTPVIGVLDSGLNEHPLIDGAVLARSSVP